MKKIYTFALSIVLIFLAWGQDLPDNGTGIVHVTVMEEGKEGNLPCRAWVDINNSRYYKPISPDCFPYERDMSFSCNGSFEIRVPAGKAIIHIERGKEYLPVNKEISVISGQVAEVSIVMERWIDMASLGWYSMDIHCHFGADSMAIVKQQSLADDVNYQPVLSVWNSRQYKTQQFWQDNGDNPTILVDPKHLVAFNNQEIERIGGAAFESIGALHLIGLKKPLKNPESYAFPADVSLAKLAREESPDCIIDCDKPVWGENVVTMAMGYFNSVQICHNHYHRFSDMDMCCGMAVLKKEKDDPSRWGGLFWQTNQAYYSFLNCGIKLAATGGSAMGVMRVPLGYNRTYMKIDGELSQKNALKALKDGRTFATSGPMLFFTVNGKESGTTIQFVAGDHNTVKIEANLESIEPVESLEIIHNGKIIKQISLNGALPNPVLNKSLKLDFSVSKSGWFAARAIYFNQNHLVRQAHTSPVYVLVDKKPIAFKKDALRLISWIDKLIAINGNEGRYQSEEQREQVLVKYREARQYYQNIIDN